MTKKLHLLLIIFLVQNIAIAQSPADLPFVDSVAVSTRYKNDLTALTHELTDRYSTDHFKARAIFRWITENISYDYKFYNKYQYKGKEPKTFKCKNEKHCEARRIAWEIKYIDRVLKKKKAVCQGYAMLFKKMCDIAGLKSELVAGYVRTEPYQVGTAGKLDHAWNAVWLDSAYYLLDATWAAGGCGRNEDGKLLSFEKNFNEYYWLTPAVDFARNHFPQNSRWSLLQGYTKDSFAKNPYYLPGELQNIRIITPSSGFIRAEKGDTIHFKIEYKGHFKDLQINSNVFRNPDIWVFDQISKRKKARRMDTLALKKQQYIQYEQKEDSYDFHYIVNDHSLYYLDILFDRQRVLRFKVKIDSL